MSTLVENKSVKKIAGSSIAWLFVLCTFAVAISGQAPPNPVPAQENILAGALIVPMDNFHQGNNAQTTFNLRAYGLVNLLLQNNIPVKWAIKPGKSKDDVDFTANVTRISGVAGNAGPADASFSGGPFIVPREFDTQVVRDLITSFNGGGIDVTVYKTNANASVDIRYTLTHKPKIAIGPDGGGFGTGVHQDLFDSAGIGPAYYDSVTDDIINANACYTIATQAHSTESGFVNLYKQFVQNGGNLVLQCASINTFENDANGHFQTTLPGYSVFGTNDSTQISTPHVYPEGSMPFNQFIGILGDQDGAITDYAYAPGGGPANGNRVSVRNTTGDEADPTIDHSNKFVATVSQLLGPGLAGGAVFALGGHDYDRGNASAIENINGRRMVLNALFVPVTRPNSCGLNQANVLGFKSVRRLVDLDGGPLGAGDTVRWTIDYINNSPIDVTDFQIRDIVRANLTLVPGSNQVTGVSANSIAARNPLYDGIGDDASSDLLAGGGLLKAGGRITVIVDMIINPGTPSGTVMANQTSATGTGVVTLALSDNIDATNTSIFGPGVGPPPGSILQNQNPASIDPTTVTILAPSAADASIDGMVRDSNGIGINKAVITIVNAETSETRRVMTNAFGYYIATDLQAGDVHVVSVSHKRYSFPTPSFTFTLNDNVSGLTFVAGLPDSRGSR